MNRSLKLFCISPGAAVVCPTDHLFIGLPSVGYNTTRQESLIHWVHPLETSTVTDRCHTIGLENLISFSFVS